MDIKGRTIKASLTVAVLKSVVLRGARSVSGKKSRGRLPFQRLQEPVVIRKKEKKIKTQFAFETLAEELRLRGCHFERRQMQQGTRDWFQDSILTWIWKTNHNLTTANGGRGPSKAALAPGGRKAARHQDRKMDCADQKLTVTMPTARRGFNEKSMASRIKAVQRRVR